MKPSRARFTPIDWQHLPKNVTLSEISNLETNTKNKQSRKVLVVLAKKSESTNIFRIIQNIDPNAFVSQSKVIGVFGEGFDRIKVKPEKKKHGE